MASGRIFETVAVQDSAPEDDVEAAFENWRSSFDDAESPGNIRAFRIPLDEHGRASHSASNQVRLGTWPVDQYDFDTLCDKIMREFMLPSESMMAVRLIGTMAGKQGVRFNKIVTLQRPNPLNALPNPGAKDGIADIMRSMQESNERMMRMFQEVGPGAARSGDSQSEMMRTVAMMRVMMEPMMGLMGPMLAAVAGRPLPAPGPGSSMKEMVETMMLMDKFLGRRGGGGNEGEADWVKVTTAVAGVAKPLLELAAANKGDTSTRQRRSGPAAAVPPAQSMPPAVAAPVSRTVPPPPVTPVPGGVDLSRPTSVSPVATFADPQKPTPTGEPMLSEVKKEVDTLVSIAAQGSDPVQVANLFFEQTMLTADEKAYGQLASLVENPGFLSMLALYNPDVHHYAAFFEALRGQLMARITAEDEASANDPG